MKTNKNAETMDIEELLLSKSWEELSSQEKEYALTQVENEQEYSELKATLLSIKQVSSSQENVIIPNRIKEELLQKMETKPSLFGGIAAFLFPKDVPLFRKPGLQFATLAMLLLLVVNIGLDFTKNQKGELAVNTIKQKDQFSPLPIDEKKEEGFYDIEINEKGTDLTEPQKEQIPAPIQEIKAEIEEEELVDAVSVEEDNLNLRYRDEVADDKEVVNLNLTKGKMAEKKQEALPKKLNKEAPMDGLFKDVAVADVAPTNANSSQPVLLESMDLKSVSVESKKKKIKSTSLSLSENEELIGLLFVAM